MTVLLGTYPFYLSQPVLVSDPSFQHPCHYSGPYPFSSRPRFRKILICVRSEQSESWRKGVRILTLVIPSENAGRKWDTKSGTEVKFGSASVESDASACSTDASEPYEPLDPRVEKWIAAVRAIPLSLFLHSRKRGMTFGYVHRVHGAPFSVGGFAFAYV